MFQKFFDRLEEYLLVGSLVFNVILIFVQVLMRYVFKNSLSWSEELARYVFLWQTWIGASLAVKERRHLRVEVLANLFSGQNRRIFELLILSIWFCFCLFLGYQGSKLTLFLFQRGQTSPALGIPMGYAYASVPVGCFLMAYRLILEVRFVLKSDWTPLVEEVR